MARRRWLGNNSSGTLTVGEVAVAVGAVIELSEAQETALVALGHRFDEVRDEPVAELVIPEGPVRRRARR